MQIAEIVFNRKKTVLSESCEVTSETVFFSIS